MTPSDPKKPLHLFEIMEKVSKTTTKEEAARVLKDHNCPALRDTLRAAYDPQIRFLVPTSKPPYKPNKEESVPTTLLREYEKYKFFVFFRKGPNVELNNLPDQKRQNMYIQLLEGIHPKDAEIVLDMVNKKIDYKNVNATTARLAFPDLWKDVEE